MSNARSLELGFTLGQWLVEPLKNSITREGETKRIENRLMQTLVFLAEHQQETVSRQRFFDVVWQGLVVNEEALSRAISLLRSALEDDTQNPTYIKTVPGKGYRLVAEARPVDQDEKSEENSIAVLPFVNLSEDPNNEYFSDGIAEEILNSLAQVPDFKVVARTSSFAFKGRNEDLREIGKLLDVSHLLEGSVRKSGDRVRITAQLIKAADGFHLWSETFDRGVGNIFAVQDEIAVAVVDKLKVHMLGDVEKKREIDPEVYSLYLQALYFLKPGNSDSIKKALAMFQQVAERDPDYGPAWVGLADACWYLISYDAIDKPWAMEVAEQACNKALELNVEHAEAHLCRALLTISFGQDWSLAKAAMDRARQLAPGMARVWLQAGNLASSTGDLAHAEQLLQKALSLDPLNTTCHIWLANVLVALNRLDEAREIINRGLAISPDRSILHMILGRIHFVEGDQETACHEMEMEPPGFWRDYALTLAQCYAEDSASETLPAFIEKYADAAPFQISELYGVRGDIDSAFEWLNRTIEIKDNGITEMFGSPHLAKVREDDRWAALVEKRGLA